VQLWLGLGSQCEKRAHVASPHSLKKNTKNIKLDIFILKKKKLMEPENGEKYFQDLWLRSPF
jgi:hypothetical protein